MDEDRRLDPNPPERDRSADVVIEAADLGKRFDLYHRDRDRLLEWIGPPRHQPFWALRHINFQVKRGQAVGLIGSNGAGKSTLLRLLAGISRPTEGQLYVRASISSLLDLGLGFHTTFTGRENVYLNCTLQGMTRGEVDGIIEPIIDFSELRDFIDYPVKTYSAGMKLRLGFAIAAFIDYDIFLIDEVLTVGDSYFQRKCLRKIETFIEAGKTIFLVSHDLHAVRSLCDEALWLRKGSIIDRGRAVDVVDNYIDSVRTQEGATLLRAQRRGSGLRSRGARTTEVGGAVASQDPSPMDVPGMVKRAVGLVDVESVWSRSDAAEPYQEYHGETPTVTGTGEARLLGLKILGPNGEEQRTFQTGDALTVVLTIKTTEPIVDPIFGVAIHRNDDVYVFGPNTRFDRCLFGTYHGIYTFYYHLPRLPLLRGVYLLSVALWHRTHLRPYLWHNRLYEITLASDREDHGLVVMDHTWGVVSHIESRDAQVDTLPSQGEGEGGSR